MEQTGFHGKSKAGGHGARRILLGAAALIAVLFAAFLLYTGNYYHADAPAQEAMAGSPVRVRTEGNMTVFFPPPASDRRTGYIFYPGALVEHTAYAPLLAKLSDEGITCVLYKMPFHLAIFGVDEADGAFAALPGISRWYIGGHSLGGAFASAYADRHAHRLAGIALLGAYGINRNPLPALYIYGSNDGLLNRGKLAGLPNVLVIQGGNHAYFGDYGEQRGDGAATLSRQAQQEQAVRALADFMAAGQ